MTDRRCIVCTHRLEPDEPQTCDACVSKTRRRLIRIEQLYPLLPHELAGRAGASAPPDPTGIRGDHEAILGGDVLVMLGPGSTGWHTDPVDIDSVLGVLERWERDWRITFGESAATDRATVSGCVLYLLRRLIKAATEHHAFDECANDLAAMCDRLELALRTGPQHSPVPCITCGRRTLERPPPREDGRAFEWQCARCHRNYTLDEFWMACRQNGQAV